MPESGAQAATGHGVVIGGTRSLGLVIARSLADCGRPVTVLGRSYALDVPESRAPVIACHTADLWACEALPAAMDAIETGGGPWQSLVFTQRFRGPQDPWQGEWRLCIEATRRIVEHVAYRPDPLGRPRSIVIIGSNASRLDNTDQPVAYHAVRAALEQMVRSWAVRLGPLGVRVNMVSPTMVRKGQAGPGPLEHLVPLGYACSQQEIADVVLFLCSPAARYVTGQVIMVDGGFSLLAQGSIAQITLSDSQ